MIGEKNGPVTERFFDKHYKSISSSMKADSRLLVVEFLIESGPGFSVAKLLDLEVLIMGGGRERSLDGYTALFNSVDLSVAEVTPTRSGPALLECIYK